MDIRAAEISDIIRKQIENYDKKVSVTETGTVLTAGDGIARVYGLSGALAGELLEFEGAGGTTVQGMVLNLEEDNVGVALLGQFESIAFMPVCIGSCTDLRAMMPGALISTWRRLVPTIGLPPSTG